MSLHIDKFTIQYQYCHNQHADEIGEKHELLTIMSCKRWVNCRLCRGKCKRLKINLPASSFPNMFNKVTKFDGNFDHSRRTSCQLTHLPSLSRVAFFLWKLRENRSQAKLVKLCYCEIVEKVLNILSCFKKFTTPEGALSSSWCEICISSLLR